MTEVVILEEMLEAGVEAYDECRKRKLGPADVCVAVFLAMRAVEEIAQMRIPEATVH